MQKAIIGKKLGMTQVFEETGIVTPVTVIEAGPCPVIQKKTMEEDGYESVQVGFGTKKKQHVNKATAGHFGDVKPTKRVKEFRLEGATDLEVGEELTVSIFEDGDMIDVTGISKGKGFQGSIKRHNMSIGPMSHGSKFHRGGGAMAGAEDPGKVRKGKPLPGQMGNKQVTVQNLRIVSVDEERGLLLVKGAIPGPKGSMVYIKDTVKNNK